MIALDRIGLLHILPELFGRVIRPQAVVDELYAGKSIYGGSESIFDCD
jgi:predicted nucleic acid-binding protein